MTVHLGVDSTAANDPNRFGTDPAAADGQNQDVSVFVYVPNLPGHYPLVEMSHGLGDSRADWTVWGQTLASRGIVTVLLDRRTDVYPPATVAPPISCSSSVSLSGPNQVTENNSDYLGVSYNVNSADILRVLRWAIQESADPASLLYQKVDGERLGITGHSWGGYLSILAAYLSNTNQVDPDTGARDWPKLKAMVLFDPTEFPGNADDVALAGHLTVPTAVLPSGSPSVLDPGHIFGALPPRLDKLGVQIVGAAHNEAENPDDDDNTPPVASPDPLHQQMFMRYAMAWLEYWVIPDCTVSPYLDGPASALDQTQGRINVLAGSAPEQGCQSPSVPEAPWPWLEVATGAAVIAAASITLRRRRGSPSPST